MAESLLIHIPHTGFDWAEWAVLDERGNILGDIMRTNLSEAATRAGGRRVTVIASADDVLLAEVDTPAANAAQAKKAIPFAFEDSLAEDVDDLHFAFGKPTQDKQYPTAIISRQQMDTLKGQCDAAGLHLWSIVPEQLSIPIHNVEQPRWCGVLASGRAVLRQREAVGFVVDADNFSQLLASALREAGDTAPTQLTLYKVTNTPEPTLDIDVTYIDCSSPLAVFAHGFNTAPINLLQGDYSHRQQLGKLLRPWKMSAVLLVLLLCIWGGVSWATYWRLGQQEIALNQQIESVLKQAFPQMKNTADPAKRMRLKLKELGSGGDGFIILLGEVSRAIAADNDMALRSIGYRDARIDIDLEAARLESLDAMKKRIEASGRLSAAIQSANKENNRVRGRLRIQSR